MNFIYKNDLVNQSLEKSPINWPGIKRSPRSRKEPSLARIPVVWHDSLTAASSTVKISETLSFSRHHFPPRTEFWNFLPRPGLFWQRWWQSAGICSLYKAGLGLFCKNYLHSELHQIWSWWQLSEYQLPKSEEENLRRSWYCQCVFCSTRS